ncbi:MAG: hypothetical protein WCK47_03380 [bacterium]|nr:hypothetical protein [Candidatus Sumerlaeota bacterium]
MFGILFLCCAGCLCLLFSQAGQYARFPLDAYYYLEMARNLARGAGPVVRFEQGVPNKFFPGYPLLLGCGAVAAPVDVAWIWLHAALIPMCGCLMTAVLWRGGAGRIVALAAAALMVSNYDFVKWATIPYSELAALFWGLAACLLYLRAGRSNSVEQEQSCPRSGYARWVLPGLAAGMAVLSRPTAAILVVLLPVFDVLAAPAVSRRRMRAPAMIVFVAAACVLPAVYLVYQRMISGQAVPYLAVFSASPDSMKPPEIFIDNISKLLRQYNVNPPSALNILIILSLMLFYGVAIPSLRGYAGRGAFLGAWALVVYLAAHSLWYYSSERYNVLVEPVVAYLLARGVEWLYSRNHRADQFGRWKAGFYALTIATICLVQLLQGYYVIKDHQKALARGAGRPRELAQLANARPGTVWSEMGPEFAYYHAGTTYFDLDEPFFYRRTASCARDYFARQDVRWVVTRQTPEKWFAAHPDISSGALSLRRYASDGIFTLYEVTGGKAFD